MMQKMSLLPFIQNQASRLFFFKSYLLTERRASSPAPLGYYVSCYMFARMVI